ncbi:MAG: phosphotransferase [Chitinispirillaceae bacterium]|nr:phosphotransferase [Chitinispirillaceae bacterium]
MSETVTLTPAQIDFLKRTLPGFETSDGSVELAGRAGSQRYFVRVPQGSASAILIVWDSRDEDWGRFLSIGRDLTSTMGLLPGILADDPRHGLILEEDLGDMTLKRYCDNRPVDHQSIIAVYRQALDALGIWQSPQVATHPVIAARVMDEETFVWETAYFARYCVTDYCGCEVMLDSAWERERKDLARTCAAFPGSAIHRDFQSENVMLHKERIRFVDFQGARLGPPEYDVASLLFDPYSERVDEAMRDDLYGYYCRMSGRRQYECGRRLYLCAAQRLMQALGAYGNLSLHKGKEWYREFIPVALERLGEVMGKLDGFPAIKAIVKKCREVVKGMGGLTCRSSTNRIPAP